MVGVMSPHVVAHFVHRTGTERTVDARVPTDAVLQQLMLERLRNGHGLRTEGARQMAAMPRFGVAEQVVLVRVQRVELLLAPCGTEHRRATNRSDK